MNKPFLSTLLIAAMVAFSFASHAHETPLRRMISTSGHGEVKVKPDLAKLHLSVRATHKSGEAAKKDVDDRINQFLDALKTLNIEQKDVIASNLQVSARYEHTKGESHFKGYEARRNLVVTVHKLSMLTDIMDLALAQRLEGIDQIQYDSSAADRYRDEAHRLAIENSKRKAEALATAYDAELGPVITINYHNRAPIYDGVRTEAAADVMMVKSARPGTYIADEIVFSDSIQVTFDLIISE